MRILLLTPSLPYPLHQGGAIRNFGIVRGLHDAGHEITLLSFHDDSFPPASTPLAKLCKTIETVPVPQRTTVTRLRDLVFSGQPDLARRLYSRLFENRLQTLLKTVQFDLVQAEGLEMTAYLASVRQHQPRAKRWYDAHNAEYDLQRTIFQVDREDVSHWPAAVYSYIQSRRIAWFEAQICQQADGVIAVSDEDADALRSFRPDRRIAVVPNGVISDDYGMSREQLELGKHVLVFTGKMDYRPNVDAVRWFTTDILPEVHKQIPDARLYVVGQKPHAKIEKLRDKHNVSITGWVNDVRPFLHAAQVYIAPLRMGSGTRLKILEAMAAGCAVVATSPAAAGLQADAKNIMLIADDEESFCSAVVTLLRDADRRQALGSAAQTYVRQNYDWSVLIPRLLAAYKDAQLG
jgi:polysaccharide biosynthesis protein PslH